MEKKNSKKNYHELEKVYLGTSDSGFLIVSSANKTQDLTFGGDGTYKAYLGNFKEVDLKSMEHYTEVFVGYAWLRIFDDSELTLELIAKKIHIYRCKGYGCIILTEGEIIDKDFKKITNDIQSIVEKDISKKILKFINFLEKNKHFKKIPLESKFLEEGMKAIELCNKDEMTKIVLDLKTGAILIHNPCASVAFDFNKVTSYNIENCDSVKVLNFELEDSLGNFNFMV